MDTRMSYPDIAIVKPIIQLNLPATLRRRNVAISRRGALFWTERPYLSTFAVRRINYRVIAFRDRRYRSVARDFSASAAFMLD